MFIYSCNKVTNPNKFCSYRYFFPVFPPPSLLQPATSQASARIYRPSFRENKPKTRWFSITKDERFGLVFTKTGSINSGTGCKSCQAKCLGMLVSASHFSLGSSPRGGQDLTKRSRKKSVIKEKSRCTQRRYDMNGKSHIQGDMDSEQSIWGRGGGRGGVDQQSSARIYRPAFS